MADYSDLIARLEKAEGPDRQIDVDIYQRLRPVDIEALRKMHDAGDVSGYWFWMSDSPYTASLDAAIALKDAVLPRYRWSCGNWNVAGSVLSPDRNNDQRAEAETPAIALLIATLKALQSLEQKDAA